MKISTATMVGLAHFIGKHCPWNADTAFCREMAERERLAVSVASLFRDGHKHLDLLRGLTSGQLHDLKIDAAAGDVKTLEGYSPPEPSPDVMEALNLLSRLATSCGPRYQLCDLYGLIRHYGISRVYDSEIRQLARESVFSDAQIRMVAP